MKHPPTTCYKCGQPATRWFEWSTEWSFRLYETCNNHARVDLMEISIGRFLEWTVIKEREPSKF